MEAGEGAVELDKLVSDFCLWQENTSEVLKSNACLQRELKNTHRKVLLLRDTSEANHAEVNQLKATVDKLHGILTKRCDFEGENLRLKEELVSMQKMSAMLEETHHCQMTEALDDLQELSSKHKAALTAAEQQAQSTMQQSCQAKDKEIQDKVDEVKLLQREKSELERARHTDIVKLRLEYDAKMLKLQKQQQNMRVQNSHSTSTSNEIFRKKLQHMKAESVKEKAFLKKRVEELERQQLTVAHRI